jgi:hypothetical protein
MHKGNMTPSSNADRHSGLLRPLASCEAHSEPQPSRVAVNRASS